MGDEEEAVVASYEGERNEAGERHGQGTAVLPSGDTYTGAYEAGKRHGQGTYSFFSTKDKYEGSFEMGMRSSKGNMTYANGSTYDGDWEMGFKHGARVLRRGRCCRCRPPGAHHPPPTANLPAVVICCWLGPLLGAHRRGDLQLRRRGLLHRFVGRGCEARAGRLLLL